MAIVSVRWCLAAFTAVLVGTFFLFLYLMATIDPLPPGYIIENSTEAAVNPVVTKSRRFQSQAEEPAEMLFSLKSPNNVKDNIVYGPFPIVFDDPSRNYSRRSGDSIQNVFPPIVPMLERQGNKTVVKSMILSRFEPKAYQRRSVDTTNKTESVLDIKIIDEMGSNLEIKVPIDPVDENKNITVRSNAHRAGYNVFVNGKKYNVSEFVKVNASVAENRNISIEKSAVNKSNDLSELVDESKIIDLQHKKVHDIETDFYDNDGKDEAAEIVSSKNTTMEAKSIDAIDPRSENDTNTIFIESSLSEETTINTSDALND